MGVTKRNYKAESLQAKKNAALSVVEVRASRDAGTLGAEVIKMAQVLIRATIPYSKTQEEEVTTITTLADGSKLTVTLVATDRKKGVLLPFGADRQLLAWLFDRAIRSDSPYISLESASEYRKEMGLGTGGKGLSQFKDQFERIASLMVSISRESDTDPGIAIAKYLLVEKSYLPKSLATKHRGNQSQQRLPGMETYGFQMSEGLWNDIKRFHYALPREMWRKITGPSQVQDMILWLAVRCHGAQTESVVPWEALEAQFPAKTNLPRMRMNMRNAVKQLRTIWPEMNASVIDAGVLVGHCAVPLLPNDPSKGRVRRLTATT